MILEQQATQNGIIDNGKNSRRLVLQPLLIPKNVLLVIIHSLLHILSSFDTILSMRGNPHNPSSLHLSQSNVPFSEGVFTPVYRLGITITFSRYVFLILEIYHVQYVRLTHPPYLEVPIPPSGD
jgi:hypothetical protein